MKILFNNLVISATLTSTNASNNYPPANLKDTSLIKRLQSSLDWDTIQIVLADDSIISDVFYGYTSAMLLRLRFYDYENVLLYELSIANPDSWIGHHSFSPVPDVARIELYMEGELDVYLGALAAGVAVKFPNPQASWPETPADNSVTSESPFGQSTQDFVRPLRQYTFTFPPIQTRAAMNAIQSLYNGVGIGYPIWVDPTEDDHTFIQPLYCKITEPMDSDKQERTYGFSLTLKEAR